MAYVTGKQRKEKRKKKLLLVRVAVSVVLLIAAAIAVCGGIKNLSRQRKVSELLKSIPAYSGQTYVEVNGNNPYFDAEERTATKAFELYSNLDAMGRCGEAYANICPELMPTEGRGKIGQIKPTGWVQAKYEGIVDSNPPYLYNRCHLIAFCLAGENANEKNLITGTRYMNVKGMLPFEEKVAAYVDKTGNHVLYRVTPIFDGSNLLASGVLMEAYSVEDEGKGICFCVYCYNVQPGIEIDYATGKNHKK